MSKEGEKRPLLENEKKINDDYSSGSARQEQQPQQPGSSSAVACNPLVSFVRRNKSKVPGYGMWRLLRHGGLYPLVVLTVLLAVYLLNQLDRYTLPIVTTSMGPDLRYGDKTCQSNPHFNDSYPHYNGSCADFTLGSLPLHLLNLSSCSASFSSLLLHLLLLLVVLSFSSFILTSLSLSISTLIQFRDGLSQELHYRPRILQPVHQRLVLQMVVEWRRSRLPDPGRSSFQQPLPTGRTLHWVPGRLW